jgi:hypothetical protein
LIAKELSFFVTTKSLQQCEKKRFAANRKSATQRALSSEHGGHREWVTPPAMRMVIKIKELREKQFVRIRKQRARKVASGE